MDGRGVAPLPPSAAPAVLRMLMNPGIRTLVLVGLAAGPLFDLSMQASQQLLNPNDYTRAVLGETR